MFNVCPNCGEYSVEKRIDTSGPLLTESQLRLR
jgi:ribosomal protein L32